MSLYTDFLSKFRSEAPLPSFGDEKVIVVKEGDYLSLENEVSDLKKRVSDLSLQKILITAELRKAEWKFTDELRRVTLEKDRQISALNEEKQKKDQEISRLTKRSNELTLRRNRATARFNRIQNAGNSSSSDSENESEHAIFTYEYNTNCAIF